MKKISLIAAFVFILMFVLMPVCYAGTFIDDVIFNLEEGLEDGSVAGLGVMYAQQPYDGVDDSVYPVPIIVAEYKKFFIDASVFGYYLNSKDDALRFGVIGSPRFQGYDADDSTVLSGMEDRDWAFDAGLRLNWINEVVNVNFEAVGDVSGVYDGAELRVMFSRPLLDGALTPRAGIKWQSGELVDYYYGVRPGEAAAGRGAYEPNSDIEYVVGLTASVPISEKWAAVGDLQCNFLSDNAQDSPIVNQDAPMRYVLGAVYRF